MLKIFKSFEKFLTILVYLGCLFLQKAYAASYTHNLIYTSITQTLTGRVTFNR